MQAGKLPLGLLSELLGKIDVTDPRVFLGAKLGEDAALIDFGDRYLVAKTDPITFASDLIGWYLVQVNCNDLAVMGATPKWVMVTLLLPEGISEAVVSGIFDQLLEACESRNITLVGGHTEVTYDLPRPIAIGCMLGEVAKDRVVMTSGAQVGDSIILTQGIAIEGTALLAREAGEKLVAAGVEADVIERARDLLFKPGISVSEAARIACDSVNVHAMHDPTEGGVATGLLELATGAGTGMRVELEKIPVLPECRVFCDALGLDPLGLIGSGALLATVSPDDAPTLIDALARQNIPAFEIGTMMPRDEGLILATSQGDRQWPTYARDELARFLTT
ncbi:MAG: AIR synthase family protein [Chloroflexi bacterium]|nr:AIR synthase family protein [Chloroflexota bacterium]MDA1228319.1 AIR synthase family protein [Chloroflexota bacterium]